MCVLYSSSLISSRSFASLYCFHQTYSSTDSYLNRQLCSASHDFPMRKGAGGTVKCTFLISSSFLINSLSMLLKLNVTLLLLMPLFSEPRLFLGFSWLAIPWRGIASAPYYRSFNNLFITIFFVYLFIICFILFCFILNKVFIWTNTVSAEVAKTAKSELNCPFVYYIIIIFFVAPSATVGKYMEQSLTAKPNSTTPALITDARRPGY